MSPLFVASVEQVVAELIQQVYIQRWRAGDCAGARFKAERAVERLLSRGFPTGRTADGQLLLDPYGAMNSFKARVGEPADEVWEDWVAASRVNAVSLPTASSRYRMTITREWHLPPLAAGRPVVLRLPLPLRGSLRGTPVVRLLEPELGLLGRRDELGRVELRLDPAHVQGVARVELSLEFESGECSEVSEAPATAADAEAELWLRPVEGLIAPSAAISALANGLPGAPLTPRAVANAAFDRLLSVLRLGDLHREHLAAEDPLGGLLSSAWVDCSLAASLFVAVCRERRIPARLVSGFLLHRAFPAPHYWAEARLEDGKWVPFDLGGWDYCRGDPLDPVWGGFFRGRVDARFIAEVAPRHFTGWGSARPPERWYRTFGMQGERVVHTLHGLPNRAPFQSDQLELEVLGPEPASAPST